MRFTRSPWKDSSVNLRGVIVSANDITALKQIETAQASQLQAQIQKTEEVLARTSRAEAALSTAQEESRIAIQKHKSNLSTCHEATLELFATDFVEKPSIDLSGLCQSILSYALKLSGFNNALVAVMEDNHLVIRAATTAWGAALGVIMRPGSDLLGKAWQSGQLVKTDNYSTWSGLYLDFYRLGSFEKPPLAAIGFP